jgi:hypothetical protein
VTSAALHARADAKRQDWANILEIAGKHVERAASIEAAHRSLQTGMDADSIMHDYFEGYKVFTCPESQAAIARAEERYLEAQETLETMMNLREQARTLEAREEARLFAVRMRHAHPVTRAVSGFLRRVMAGVA